MKAVDKCFRLTGTMTTPVRLTVVCWSDFVLSVWVRGISGKPDETETRDFRRMDLSRLGRIVAPRVRRS